MECRNNPNPIFYCPLTQLILRHPVRISNGRFYELSWLSAHLSRSGLVTPDEYKQPLKYANYDKVFEETINSKFGNHEDRYEDYDLTNDLAFIEKNI